MCAGYRVLLISAIKMTLHSMNKQIFLQCHVTLIRISSLVLFVSVVSNKFILRVILKSIKSTVKQLHTMPDKFENATLGAKTKQKFFVHTAFYRRHNCLISL